MMEMKESLEGGVDQSLWKAFLMSQLYNTFSQSLWVT